MNRIEHAEKLAGLVAVAERRERHHGPHGGVRVLAAVFANAGHIAFDVAGIERRVIERRRQKQHDNPSGRTNELAVDGRHGARAPDRVRPRR